MMESEWDIIVVGGGIAGLATTALLAKLNLRVLCIEPQLPSNSKESKSADLRSTAYLVKSIDLLKDIGAWDYLENHAEQLKVMRICDYGNSIERTQETCFDSREIGLSNFGYNIPNWITKSSLLSIVNAIKTSKIIFGVKVVELKTHLNRSYVKLSDNTVLSTKLIIGADGKNSDIRFLSNIKCKKWDDAQDAIACVVTHEKSHEGASIEILESGGPCTFVPLKNSVTGEFQSAIVWMELRSKAKNLINLSEKEFSLRLSLRTKHILGKCKLKSKRAIYPIVTQIADKFYEDRIALIAEAAHVMPPIGAQGLNTSFEDISLLVKLLKKVMEKNGDIGNISNLRNYGISRRRVTKSKMLGISLLNNTSKSNAQLTKNFRRMGLAVLKKNAVLRKTLMKAGLSNF